MGQSMNLQGNFVNYTYSDDIVKIDLPLLLIHSKAVRSSWQTNGIIAVLYVGGHSIIIQTKRYLEKYCFISVWSYCPLF